MSKSRLSWWTGANLSDVVYPEIECALTAVKDELELYQLHINELNVDDLVRQPHADVLNLHQISLQRILQTVF